MRTLIKVSGAVSGATVRPRVAEAFEEMADVLEFRRRNAAASALCAHIVQHTGCRTIEDVAAGTGLSFSSFLSLSALAATEGFDVADLREMVRRASNYPAHRRKLLGPRPDAPQIRTRISPPPRRAGVAWVLPPDEQKDMIELAERLQHSDTKHFVASFAEYVLSERRFDVVGESLGIPGLSLARWLLRIASGRCNVLLHSLWFKALESFPEARIRELCGLR